MRIKNPGRDRLDQGLKKNGFRVILLDNQSLGAAIGAVGELEEINTGFQPFAYNFLTTGKDFTTLYKATLHIAELIGRCTV